MSISTGWREQYDRMHRSYERLLAVADGEHPDARSSDTARDALYHFFQDAYHLKDWIAANTAPTIGQVIEQRFNAIDPLSLCADLCNGIKHFRLDPKRRAKTRDHSTAFTAQDVTVRPAAAGTGQPPQPALHGWRFTSQGETGDAVALAGEIVRVWDTLLYDLRLLPQAYPPTC